MKTDHEKLCRLIKDLDLICVALDSLRKGTETPTPRLSVDVYYKFLLASERIRETINILGGIIKETEGVISTT
jgi:hypothetical protein